MLEVQRDPFRRGLEVRLGAVGEGEGEAVAEEQGADAVALVGGVDGEVEEVCFWGEWESDLVDEWLGWVENGRTRIPALVNPLLRSLV